LRKQLVKEGEAAGRVEEAASEGRRGSRKG
jgi:hypothetical protein